MHLSALLILTSHVSSLGKGDVISRILSDVKTLVKCTVYVHLQNTQHCEGRSVGTHYAKHSRRLIDSKEESTSGTMNCASPGHYSFSADVMSFITKFYSVAASQCDHLNVNVLLHNIGYGSGKSTDIYRHVLHEPVNCILIEQPNVVCDSQNNIQDLVSSQYSFSHSCGFPMQNTEGSPVIKLGVDVPKWKSKLEMNGCAINKRDSVVLGGTFDRLHSGHKVLLSEAILMAKRKLVIGVSDGALLKRKTLKELIQPYEIRKMVLEDFIALVSRNGLKVHIENIEDPYGPSIVDADLDTIAVSAETEKGAHLVNAKRLERGLSKLKVHVINDGMLLADEHREEVLMPFEEEKVSSSSMRFKLLGTLRKPCPEPRDEIILSPGLLITPYIIGLTGGIATGKSSVAELLEKKGAIIVDCDKLGHESYKPGSNTFKKIVEHFGVDICREDGSINRHKLGEIVFNDNSQLQSLNEIVWPEIEQMFKKRIIEDFEAVCKDACERSHLIFVLDAAVLLEAGWEKFVHEVWVTIVPELEAVHRIVERNKLSEEDAKKRITAQSLGSWRIQNANVVLSTLWHRTVTEQMVSKAWELLQQRIFDREHQRPKL